MSNIALIFAGGTGQRMNSKSRPKQFLDIHGKPIIVHTIERFSNHPDIDGIVVVCVKGWIRHLHHLISFYQIKKIAAVVPGGANGQESIYNGLVAIKSSFPDDSVVLVHDGVRPIIDEDLISRNIESVLKNGSSITVCHATETVILEARDGGVLGGTIDRNRCYYARAPQGFYLRDLYSAHVDAREKGLTEFIDSATLMQSTGMDLYSVECKQNNIKITTQLDFYYFRSILSLQEDLQLHKVW